MNACFSTMYLWTYVNQHARDFARSTTQDQKRRKIRRRVERAKGRAKERALQRKMYEEEKAVRKATRKAEKRTKKQEERRLRKEAKRNEKELSETATGFSSPVDTSSTMFSSVLAFRYGKTVGSSQSLDDTTDDERKLSTHFSMVSAMVGSIMPKSIQRLAFGVSEKVSAQ